MPFVKTEVDIKTDYQLQSVESGWLKEGVKSPKHLMLDPNIVSGAQDPSVSAEVGGAYAIFVVDDHACTRCSVCVERCPSDCLYYARLPEEGAGPRTMAAVPASQAEEEE